MQKPKSKKYSFFSYKKHNQKEKSGSPATQRRTTDTTKPSFPIGVSKDDKENSGEKPGSQKQSSVKKPRFLSKAPKSNGTPKKPTHAYFTGSEVPGQGKKGKVLVIPDRVHALMSAG